MSTSVIALKMLSGRRPDFLRKTMQEPRRGSQLGPIESGGQVPRRGTLSVVEVRLRRTETLRPMHQAARLFEPLAWCFQTNSAPRADSIYDASSTLET